MAIGLISHRRSWRAAGLIGDHPAWVVQYLVPIPVGRSSHGALMFYVLTIVVRIGGD